MTDMPECVGMAHVLGMEYANSIDGKGVWPISIAVEDEGSIKDGTWHTVDYYPVDAFRHMAYMEGLIREMYGFIHAACTEYPSLFDPNKMAGGQSVKAMPDVRFAEEMSSLGIEVD